MVRGAGPPGARLQVQPGPPGGVLSGDSRVLRTLVHLKAEMGFCSPRPRLPHGRSPSTILSKPLGY